MKQGPVQVLKLQFIFCALTLAPTTLKTTLSRHLQTLQEIARSNAKPMTNVSCLFTGLVFLSTVRQLSVNTYIVATLSGDHNSNMCWLKGTVPVNNVERNSDRVSGPKYCSGISPILFSLVFCRHNLDCNALECGGTITSSGGMSSPNFPANYALNVECQWDIFIPGGDFVELQFDYFNVSTVCLVMCLVMIITWLPSFIPAGIKYRLHEGLCADLR